MKDVAMENQPTTTGAENWSVLMLPDPLLTMGAWNKTKEAKAPCNYPKPGLEVVSKRVATISTVSSA